MICLLIDMTSSEGVVDDSDEGNAMALLGQSQICRATDILRLVLVHDE